MQERDALEVEGCMLGSSWGRHARTMERVPWVKRGYRSGKDRLGLKMTVEERSLSGLRRLAFPRGGWGGRAKRLEVCSRDGEPWAAQLE